MKSIPITPEMQARINAAAGTEVPPNSVTAFEAIGLTTAPLNKRGSIFEGATLDPGIFADLSSFLQRNNGVQLMIMHETNDLPTGRVFYAAPSPEGLRAQFYIPNDQPTLINNIETGVIGDVSLGMLATHLLCSQCQWDYRGADATIMNLIDRTCANDHTVGKDGTHLILKGIEQWSEMSLCGQGASPGAKIVSRMKASLKNSTATLESLAASGITPEAITLSTTPLANGDDMSKELLDKIELQGGTIATLTATAGKVPTLEASVTELTAKVTTAEAAVAELTAKVTTAEAAKATADQALTAANASLTEYATFLTEQAGKAMIILGLKAADAPKDAAGQIAKINEAGVTLANVIAQSGKTEGGRKTDNTSPGHMPNSAFTTNRS